MIRTIEDIELFESRLSVKLSDIGYDPTKFSISTGEDAVLDDIFSYQVYNKNKNNWYAAAAPADIQDGMIWVDSDNGVVYSQHSSIIVPAGPRLVTNHVDDVVLTTANFNAIHTMNAAGDKTFTLPSISATHIGYWMAFVKLGAGKVTIDAADTDIIRSIISSSSAGGTAYNDTDQYAVIFLQIISATEYLVMYMRSDAWILT